MHRKILIVCLLSLGMVLSIVANNNPDKSSNNNDKEPSIKVSMEAISVAFSNTDGDGVGIKEILLLAEKYCIENKVNFPIKDCFISMCIEQNEARKGVEIKVYFWDDARRKFLIITINNRHKASGHAISDG